MAELVFTILGCASSGGVPRIGNDWGRCDPTNPKNRRRRCSLLVRRRLTGAERERARELADSVGGEASGEGQRPEQRPAQAQEQGAAAHDWTRHGHAAQAAEGTCRHHRHHPPHARDPEAAYETRVLIDTSPDLREQLLSAGVGILDAVLYTHEHADHTHGINDLRGVYFNRGRRRVPVHANASTAEMLQSSFGYCFSSPAGSPYPPICELNLIKAGRAVTVDGPGGPVTALPVELEHGIIRAYGFRIGGLAYTPDLNDIPESTVPHLEGLDVWIVDAFRPGPEPHPTHFVLEEALKWIERLKPKRAILTNLGVLMDYDALSRTLPAGVEPAYDGLEIVLPASTTA